MSANPRPRPVEDREPDSWEWVPVPAVIDANGDKVVTLFDERGHPRARRVAELILEAFVGPCPPGRELRFKDGNHLNCALDNLEWANVLAPGAALVAGPGTTRPVRVDAA